MNEELLQLPATISKVQTMGMGALRLQVDTQENLSEEMRAKIMGKYDKLGWFTFLVQNKIKPEDVVDLPEIRTEKSQKTPSERLRSVLFVLWKNEGEPGEFDDFYREKMNKMIDWVKTKLEPYEVQS